VSDRSDELLVVLQQFIEGVRLTHQQTCVLQNYGESSEDPGSLSWDPRSRLMKWYVVVPVIRLRYSSHAANHAFRLPSVPSADFFPTPANHYAAGVARTWI
jgi:hypothetical protein